MNRLTIILLALLLAAPAGAQFFDEEEGGTPTTAPRSIPLNTSGNVAAALAQIPVTPTACWKFDGNVGATKATDCGGSYTLTVNGTPDKVDSPVYPSGLAGGNGSAWSFDGSTDYLSIADASTGDVFDPAGDFSVMCSITPKTTSAGNYYYISKWTASGNKKGWGCYINYADSYPYCTVSSDGSTDYWNLYGNYTAKNVPSFITFTYHYVGNGNSVGYIYTNDLNQGTASDMPGPPNNNTAPLLVGGINAAASFPGNIGFCAYYNGTVITQAQHRKAYAAYAGLIAYGNNNVALSSTTYPVIPLYPTGDHDPFLFRQSRYTTNLMTTGSGTGGLYTGSAVNIAQRGSLETCSTTPTGYAGTTTAGDGTATFACDTTDVAEGKGSSLCTLTGTTSSCSLLGNCLTVTENTDYWMEVFSKKISGTPSGNISLLEYDDTGCTNLTTTTAVGTFATATIWTSTTPNAITTQAGTVRAKIQINWLAGAAQAVAVDGVSLNAGSVSNLSKCYANTDATCTTAPSTSVGPNPMKIGSWTMTGTAGSPVAGSDSTVPRVIASTIGASNYNIFLLTQTNGYLDFTIYDSAANTWSTQTTCNPLAGAEYTWEAYYKTGKSYVCCDSVCGSVSSVGPVTATNTPIYLGYNILTTTASRLWLHDITIYSRKTGSPYSIVVIGDSVAEGITASIDTAWPRYANVSEKGTGGETCAVVLARYDADTTALGPARTVLLHCGINDVFNDRTAAQIEASITSMTTNALAAGSNLIVDTIGPANTMAGDVPKIATWNAVNAWLVGAYHAAYPTVTVLDFADWATEGTGDPTHCIAGSFDAQCIHPNATGTAAWAAIVAAAVPTP
jgi:lysophospholipase L1-like esterase